MFLQTYFIFTKLVKIISIRTRTIKMEHLEELFKICGYNRCKMYVCFKEKQFLFNGERLFVFQLKVHLLKGVFDLSEKI